MPRSYKRKIGSRSYCNYTKEKLQAAVDEIKENMPGPDWVKCFLQRHPQLTQRIAQNISHARAATDEEIVNNFFDNLERELEGLPPSNIWNPI
ncbi:hypothetical protein QE152_g36506 [Popillia japonica]|uniref:HTH CENPB-type domain-containing protein n=1 Tax=Popillia japonica TaxID=7064 RepID=A0AAW1ID42_POPJA